VWRIAFRSRAFLGGFDGEFSYGDWRPGSACVAVLGEAAPSDAQVRAAVVRALGSEQPDIEIVAVERTPYPGQSTS
jgi:hypothetical protein